MKRIRIVVFLSILSVCTMGKASNSITVEQLPVRVIGDFTQSRPFLIYLTGDGGWNNFSKQLCDDFSEEGYSVVVFDSRKYFWKAKTPEQFVHDLEEIITYYLGKSVKKEFGIVGYSFGADAGAFVPALLSSDLKEKLHPMVLISPGISTDLEVRLTDLIGMPETDGKYKILPELDKTTVPVLCLIGEDEELEIKEYLKETGKISLKTLPGGHRFNYNTERLAQLIIHAIDPA